MEKEMISKWKFMDKEIDQQEENLANLQLDLAQAQDALSQAQMDAESTDKASRSTSLMSVQEIEAARLSAQKVNQGVADHRRVTENLELAIKNNEDTIQKTHLEKAALQKRIWQGYIEVLTDEIRECLGEKVYQYWCAVGAAHPDVIQTCNFAQGELMYSFINKPLELAAYRKELFSKIISGKK